MAGQPPFAPLVKGEAPSLLDTDRANEVVDACAAFTALKILPENAGRLVVNGRHATLQLDIEAAAGIDTDERMIFTVIVGGVATNTIVHAELE